MCGIAGTYQIIGGCAATELMGDCLGHRGPDDRGLYSFWDGSVLAHLAHRRLSIIDLRHGHQPMVKDGVALAYNGELYNYRDLRSELGSLGVQFQTNSDTEVVLEAWRRWGTGCLRRFRGMFAFALLDQVRGSLWLARDQLGIKPLHYTKRGSGVAFASELKALTSAFGRDFHADTRALIASMLYYWVPDDGCAVREVRKVQPGSWIEFRPDGSHRTGRYWVAAEEAAAASSGGALPDLARVVEESVLAHLVADVPVSSFLSGGLDSSIVTVLAQRARCDIDAYTITFRAQDQRLEAMPDDAIYARKVADQFGIKLHEIEVAPDIADLLPRMVGILDEPIGDPAAINTLLMCEAARERGVKVVLSGMGADELFGGYRRHTACLLAARYQRLPGPIRSGVRSIVDGLPVAAGGRGLRYPRWAKRFLTFSELSEEAAFRRSYSLYDAMGLDALLGPDLDSEVTGVLEEHAAMYHDNLLTDPVDRMCLADSRYFLPGLNLTYTDRASMAASTEVRVPFVDPQVFSAAFSFPGKEKVHWRQGKLPLKRAALNWLPEEVVTRPKSSFSAPLRAWIARDLKELVDDVLVGGDLVASGFLDREAVDRLVEEDRSGREDRAKQIWQLLTLELWYQQNRVCGVAL